MVVLIVYILIAPLVDQGIEINLPETAPHKITSQDALTITVSQNGTIYLGSSKISIDNLISLLQKKAETGVVVKADKGVAYGTVVDVLDKLNSSGITRVGLATQIKK